MFKFRTAAIAALFLPVPAAATDSAQLLIRHRLPVAVAQIGLNVAAQSCEAAGYRVSAVVVDVDAGLQALVRGDDAGFQTVQSATDKAMTSAMYGVDSSVWVDRAAKSEPPPRSSTSCPISCWQKAASSFAPVRK